MIYIFDDKKNRQEAYMWTSEKFAAYADWVMPIYQYREVQEEAKREEIFSDGNTILFHESFFDADFNRHHREAIEIRQRLEAFAQSHPNFYVAFFSGSKSGRLLSNNVGYLPVSFIYQNLEEFINSTRRSSIDLKYLLYGKNPNQEIELVRKLNAANNSLEIDNLPKLKEGSAILIARTNTINKLPQIVIGANYSMTLGSDTDEDLHQATVKHLQERSFDKLFIPLCFGPSLSDLNGLRLAAHIRCTNTVNQCTPIYIYSFVEIDEIISHDCFDILKTKNVYFIDYKVSAFKEAMQTSLESMKSTELSHEIAKLKLDIPGNYEDSHSIANEWSIYRWAMAINADDSAIDKIRAKVDSQLYFKYLNTIYPTSKIGELNQNKLQIDHLGRPKILYVDDDAEKGWYEILCRIFSDINNIEHVDYLGDDLRITSQEEIISMALRKIKEDDIDLVILDFRLHPNDFTEANISDITGEKLLREIKKLNPGIQVIIFSATNKIWNLQVLQEPDMDGVPGADGFIIKESPENSIDGEFTNNAILGFIKTVTTALKMHFLKKVWKGIEKIKTLPQFTSNPANKYHDFQLRLNNNLDIAFKLLVDTKYSSKYFNYAYLQLFQIIEDFSNLLCVFKEGSDSYVCVNEKEVLVQKTLPDKWESAITFENGKYKLQPKIITTNPKDKARRLDTNYKISAILIFRLGFENSSFLKWTDIYTIRNTKAAHFNVEDAVDEEDIFTILNFIKSFINDEKQKETFLDRGLKMKSIEESLELLKTKFKK